MGNIFLIGFMGAGKTTVGKLLAEQTSFQHIDFDEELEKVAGCSIPEYFEKYGENRFRQLEHELLRDFNRDNHVISTGGGIVLKKENREVLKRLRPVIYLETKPEIFMERVQNDKSNIRPLVVSKRPEEIEEIFKPRKPLYEDSATFTVNTSDKTPSEIVKIILEKIESE